MSTGSCLVLILNLQEPVSHVVARPSPNDILEWRKFVSHWYISHINLCCTIITKKNIKIMLNLCYECINVVEPVANRSQHSNLTFATRFNLLIITALSKKNGKDYALWCQLLNFDLFVSEWLILILFSVNCLRLCVGGKWRNTFCRFVNLANCDYCILTLHFSLLLSFIIWNVSYVLLSQFLFYVFPPLFRWILLRKNQVSSGIPI